jgi:hypothetical protein
LDADDLSRLLPSLSRLAELLLSGRARREDAWQHALSMADLAAFGLTCDECRGLVACGLLETQKSPNPTSTRCATDDRMAGSPREPSAASRFVLTDAGLAVVTKYTLAIAMALREATVAEPPFCGKRRPDSAQTSSSWFPYYDIDLRELSVSGQVILRLSAQAHNLAAVLTGFELARWKPRVAHPLNGRPGGSDPRRLATAAYNLNDRQDVIDFHADDGALRWNWRHQRPTTRAGNPGRPRGHRKPRS